jgi:hypothetical protein
MIRRIHEYTPEMILKKEDYKITDESAIPFVV